MFRGENRAARRRWAMIQSSAWRLLGRLLMLWLLEDQLERSERLRSSPQRFSSVPPSLIMAAGLCALGALVTLLPFWPSLILASWVAALVSPALERAAPTSSKRKRLI